MKNIWNFIKKLFGFESAKVPQIQTDVPDSSQPPHGNGESGIPEINIGEIRGASNSEKKIIGDAVEYVRRVVYSNEFKDGVLQTQFTSTNGLTNEHILEKFITKSVTVNVEMYTGSFIENRVWKTQGKDIGDGVVYANRYFISSAFDLADLILHEVAHQLGFHHVSASESTSVPYRMNQLFKLVAAQIGIK